MKKELPIDKIPNKRVSSFTPGWEISIEVKTIDLSQLILKDWKKKKHKQKKINSDQTTFLNTFYKHHTRLKVQRSKYKAKVELERTKQRPNLGIDGRMEKMKVLVKEATEVELEVCFLRIFVG
ncbi:hypothetical protein C1H46_036928 [Malus baccata]|uniref:Uncharacterized protein n=1 Tax=Malus baccata TaxID=106549 RepID=A0A540KTI3_MALBA|nr:hypothetical protein C1H46_036928 [Malus baccata]